MRDRDWKFNAAFAASSYNYDHAYRRLDLDPAPDWQADPDEIKRMALASEAPAQEALNVAYAQAAPNVTFLPRKPAGASKA